MSQTEAHNGPEGRETLGPAATNLSIRGGAQAGADAHRSWSRKMEGAWALKPAVTLPPAICNTKQEYYR